MTTRERKLAIVLAAVVAVVGVLFLANMLFLQPRRNLTAQLNEKDRQISQRLADIKAERDRVKKIEELSPRLAKWEKISLPEGDPRPEAFKSHLGVLRVEYLRYLNKVLADSGFKARSVKPGDFDSRSTPSFARGKPVYTVLPITIEGESDLLSIVRVFEALYKAPLLHQVKHFSVATQRTSQALAVKMTVEVLLVHGAEGIARRDGIFPKFTKTGKDHPPVVLAADRNYRDIARKNMFVPYDARPEGTDSGENPNSVLVYVRLTMITRSPYYGCWVARMHNLGNKGPRPDENESVLLIDAPLPRESPFQAAKRGEAKKNGAANVPVAVEDGEGEGAREVKAGLEEPIQKWAVIDRFKKKVLDLNVVRIEPLRVIAQVDEKFYAIHVGETLLTALEKPLEKEDLTKLGLTGDPAAVLKQVKLTGLKFSKDRNGFEGTFANPENQDEKKVVATKELPEEFSAPRQWTVKDRFSAEVLKLKAVLVDKDRLVFEVDKKLYSIRPGGTLEGAMAKPLGDDEIKALGLKAP